MQIFASCRHLMFPSTVIPEVIIRMNRASPDNERLPVRHPPLARQFNC